MLTSKSKRSGFILLGGAVSSCGGLVCGERVGLFLFWLVAVVVVL